MKIHRKARKYENISLVEKAEKESAEEIHTTFGEVFITQRIKRVVQPAGRQKVRKRKMNNELYQALTQHYHNLQSERKACMERINALTARHNAIDEQMTQVNDILCKHGNHIYEHFEEKGQMAESEGCMC